MPGISATILLIGCAAPHHPAELLGTVRPATETDLPGVEYIAQQKFSQYANYEPLYYKVAKDSADRHLLYLIGQLRAGKQIMLVHERHDQLDGFLMASIVTPPPVYDQSLHTLMIDDFYFSSPSLWPTAGATMLAEAERLGRQRGAIQAVAVSGNDDAVKNEFLAEHGMSRTAVWYAKPLAGDELQN